MSPGSNDIVEGCQRKELRWLGGLLGLIVIDETRVIKKGKREKKEKGVRDKILLGHRQVLVMSIPW